jgi:short-subunit dehydrogenase
VRRHGVRICALCPGPTASEFNEVAGQPRLGGSQESNDKVARVGLEALAAGKPRVISGALNWLSVEAQRLAPRRLVTRAAARMFMPRQ